MLVHHSYGFDFIKFSTHDLYKALNPRSELTFILKQSNLGYLICYPIIVYHPKGNYYEANDMLID